MLFSAAREPSGGEAEVVVVVVVVEVVAVVGD